MEPRDYLSVALQRLDLLLHREILRLRASYQLSLDEFRGLYISDEQVNQLINRSVNYEGPSSAIDELTQKAESLCAADLTRKTDSSPWHKLVTEFSLSLIEQDILLLAVAPEIDLKYETLFAYLNNDVTRKWPTFDLALRIGASIAEQRSAVRHCLLPEAQLFSSGLLQPITSATDRRSWLTTGFSAAPMVCQYLSNTSSLDPRLASFVDQRTPSINWERLPISSDLKKGLCRFSRRYVDSRSHLPTIILTGQRGLGRGLAAEAVCHELGVSSLLRVDLDALRSSSENIGQLTRALLLQQRLHAAGLYLSSFETLFDKEHKPLSESRGLLKILTQAKGPVFIPCESGTPWRELLAGQRAICFWFALPDYATRFRLWKDAIATIDGDVASSELEALAERFTLAAGQISAAVAAADDAQSFADLEAGSIGVSLLFEAARAQSDQSLGSLALKVKTIHSWDSLILPRLTLQRVKEIAAAIRNRHVVYSEWGFEKRIAAGLGLKVLFSGASGTGKTMTAGVIARDLGLDLYKIDLSGIVSKYIGETEKNLDRIFSAAENANSILFFDETDARRLAFTVHFPFPDESHRRRIWAGIWPTETPLAGDVDLDFLAHQFKLSGGNIKNIALAAAFLAAPENSPVAMAHLLQAVRREYQKLGKALSTAELGSHAL